MTIRLSVIVPTYNEAGNVAELVRRLGDVLDGIAWEVWFVDDDSPDGTAEIVAEVGSGRNDVHCLKRIGRRGLASAAMEGIEASAGEFVAVMDGDLQHDEALLPRMVAALDEGYDVVTGSRFAEDADAGGLTFGRVWVSRTGNWLACKLARAKLTDPLTGFFALRRSLFDEVKGDLSGRGFKILLDILTSAPRGIRVKELPFTFRARHSGESKLGLGVLTEFGLMVLQKGARRLRPGGRRR